MPLALPFVKPCPKCMSEKTEVCPPASGWERFLIATTRMQSYHCHDCGNKFRAGDRRRFPRSGTGSGVAYKR